MPVQQHVLNWLYSILTSEYHDVNRTYSDVAQALTSYPTLLPRTDVHTFPNGSSALLLHITGTLPVAFRGSTYRFPISIWVPHEYPREPPLVYVTPTEAMMVRPGQHVDPQGQVYHPYLVNWGQFWDDFLAVLGGVFAKEPPVVARRQQQPVQNQVQSPPPVPPLPPEMTRPPSQSRPPPPPPPPKESQSASPASTMTPSRYDSAPPLPPDAGRAQAPVYQPQHYAPVYQSPPPPGPPLPGRPAQIAPQSAYAHPPQYPPQRPYTQLQPQPQPQPPPLPPNILDEPLTLNIPTASVAPPPIPPNPEKDMLLVQLAQTLHNIRQESRAQNDASMAGLRAQRAAMQSAMAAIQSEASQLTQLSNVLTSNTHILHEAMRKADGVIERSRQHPAPQIDELLVAPTVVSNQLYTLVAEERALGDAIFMLGRAVERERVEPAVFVKMTRSLGREWYLKKALVRKIGQGMALST